MRITDDVPEIGSSNPYVQAFIAMEESKALEFDDYDEMRKAYFSIKSWLRGSKIPSHYRTIDAKQSSHRHTIPGWRPVHRFLIVKVNRASRNAQS